MRAIDNVLDIMACTSPEACKETRRRAVGPEDHRRASESDGC